MNDSPFLPVPRPEHPREVWGPIRIVTGPVDPPDAEALAELAARMDRAACTSPETAGN
jgi:hypothetical protein